MSNKDAENQVRFTRETRSLYQQPCSYLQIFVFLARRMSAVALPNVLCGWLPISKGWMGLRVRFQKRSCVRPVCAVLTAGPDGIRRSGS